MDYETTYYLRVRHRGASGAVSDWSSTRSFTTQKHTYSEIGKLLGSFGSGGYYGFAVSVSRDGSRIAVGAKGVTNYQGRVNVYVKKSSSWVLEATLVPGLGDYAYFGESLSLSDDGSRIVVGARGYQYGVGTALVFVRNESIWTQEAQLSHTLENYTYFGFAVAMSGDGQRLIVGAYFGYGNAGRAVVYVRAGTTWALEQDLLHSLGGYCYYGYAVSMDYTGARVAIGAPYYSNYSVGHAQMGAVVIWKREGVLWSQEALLTHTLGANAYAGMSLQLSSDASLLVVGLPGYSSNKGAALTYRRDGTSWSQEASLANPLAGAANFGLGVAISGNGRYAVIGAYNHNSGTGSARVYQRKGTAWPLHQALAINSAKGYNFGYCVSMNGLGGTIAVSEPGYLSNTGTVIIYE